ncbi:MAG: hypothetical protein QGH33_09805 [Pirellulaceae bacterium]|jgi:hypothetical protein|nr:hypothetical protein [Pirellulaceae bacterium]HJN12027.1 hypothetical protein [Pirellulaceae bacterium]
MPESPLQRPPAAPKGSGLSTIAAVMMLMLGTLFLLLLPGRIGFAIVFGGLIFFGVIGFHYLVWGRWLGEILRQAADEEGNEP